MCWKCSKPIDISQNIFRTSTCQFCGSDLHSCKNCKFYSPNCHYDCKETVEECVSDKESANFCDSFAPKKDFSSQKDDSSEKAKDAFNSLFSE